MNRNTIRILVVESDPLDVRSLCDWLGEVAEEDGKNPVFEVEHVAELSAAIEHLQCNRTDILLLELDLPDSRGIETLTRVRQHAPRLPVLVLTRLDDKTLAHQALASGASEYLVKGGYEVPWRTIRCLLALRKANDSTHPHSFPNGDGVGLVPHQAVAALNSIDATSLEAARAFRDRLDGVQTPFVGLHDMDQACADAASADRARIFAGSRQPTHARPNNDGVRP